MAFGSCVLNDVIADLHPSNHHDDNMKQELFKISAVIFSIQRTGAPGSSGPDELAAELTRAVNVRVVPLLSPSVTDRQWTEGRPLTFGSGQFFRDSPDLNTRPVKDV